MDLRAFSAGGLRSFVAGAALLSLGGCVTDGDTAPTVSADGMRSSRVSYQIGGTGTNLPAQRISGRLNIPASDKPVPAVVLLHGSAGVDGRGAFHAAGLNAAGIATFEIEMFQSGGRPARGLPATVPHSIGALLYLADRPEIDPKRIGSMGFSWGGGMAILNNNQQTAFVQQRPEIKYRANVAFYPVCYVFTPSLPGPKLRLLGRLTGAPLLVLAAENDDYDTPDACERFRTDLSPDQQRDVTVQIFPGATHKWDGNRNEYFNDIVARLGAGGMVRVTADRELALRSRAISVAFFRKHFEMGE